MMSKRWEHTVFLFLILTLIFWIFVRISPYFVPIPDRDSGVFLYISSRILQGDIPYLDLWDHKAPLIYYFNALGLWLASGSRWGAWLVEMFSVSIASTLGYFSLSKLYNKKVALLGSLFWLFYLPRALGNGNFVQVYGLIFQFGALYLWAHIITNKETDWKYLGLGICVGSSFFVQPNIVGLPALLLLSLIFHKSIAPVNIAHNRSIVASILGVMFTPVAFLMYFYSQGALEPFWDSVFVYNFLYTQGGTLADRIYSISRGILLFEGLAFLAFLGWTLTLSDLIQHKERESLKIVLLFGLPLDLLLTTASPKALSHYYISWFPTIVLLTGFFLHRTGLLIEEKQDISVTFRIQWVHIIALFLMVCYFFVAQTTLIEFVTKTVARKLFVDISKSPKYTYALYVLQNTSPNDPVYFWGNEPALNFVTQRTAPTKYIYTYPIFVPQNYANTRSITRFTQDLMRTPPRIIIDTLNEQIPSLEELTIERYPSLREFIAFFHANYEATDVILPGEWVVYKRVDPQQ